MIKIILNIFIFCFVILLKSAESIIEDKQIDQRSQLMKSIVLDELTKSKYSKFEKIDQLHWFEDINYRNKNSHTLLMIASIKNFRYLVKNLLNNGKIEIDAPDKFNRTALMFAARNANMDVVNLLIEGGANVNIEDCDGNTALIYAAKFGYTEICNLLIQKGADVTHKNIQGKSTLDYLNELQDALRHMPMINGFLI